MKTLGKWLLLLRHPESTKNLLQLFSSKDGIEPLSERGEEQIAQIRAALQALMKSYGISPDDVLVTSSSSLRSAAAATQISEKIGSKVVLDDGFKSINSGSTAGKSELESFESQNDFMRMLELYRAGVLSSYDIVGYGESVQDFEARVIRSLDIAIAGKHKLVLVIAHRSSITASLIYLARMSLKYPKDFYGYIPLDLGKVSAVFVQDDGGMSWLGINVSLESIMHCLQRDMD